MGAVEDVAFEWVMPEALDHVPVAFTRAAKPVHCTCGRPEYYDDDGPGRDISMASLALMVALLHHFITSKS